MDNGISSDPFVCLNFLGVKKKTAVSFFLFYFIFYFLFYFFILFYFIFILLFYLLICLFFNYLFSFLFAFSFFENDSFFFFTDCQEKFGS